MGKKPPDSPSQGRVRMPAAPAVVRPMNSLRLRRSLIALSVVVAAKMVALAA